ncbi:HAD-IA family hydrolase [Brevundimonas sp. SORGH_AS_0993]|uniref:HAD-IA family hydrolase n=1 Tax=Brevundimonas sp. SORGH_AS_0993 TaxID=3041794 RepID=UPI00278564B3|nr:HAD-IA family hydrolase [Brevundimonas sp. SORGH_AS_0993]MDQ1154766.1 sugar-phosphatase [Brevundimonas sp. SORGH_AS_0993]
MTRLPASRAYQAFLFDMDGTLITSTAAAERVWTRWAARHGLDAAALLSVMHGVRAADTIRGQNLPDIDLDAEIAWVERAEIEDLDGVAPIPGAVDFVDRLPPDRWAVVTSASTPLARARLKAAGVVPPAVLITAEDVERGKPDPAGYLKAAAALGVDIADCLVFEDAEAGIKAGEAAGAEVVVVTAAWTHPLATSHPTLANYGEARLEIETDGRLRLSPMDRG